MVDGLHLVTFKSLYLSKNSTCHYEIWYDDTCWFY